MRGTQLFAAAHWRALRSVAGEEVTPQQRLETSEDLVGTAIFLASQASAFMTGQVLYVDGGVTAGIRWPIERA